MFVVFDDQSPVAHFNDFERDDNLPLRLGLVLDTSDSVKRVLPQEKAAATDFLERMLRPQTDTAFVMAFGGDVKVWQTATADLEQLVEAIARLKSRDGERASSMLCIPPVPTSSRRTTMATLSIARLWF